MRLLGAGHKGTRAAACGWHDRRRLHRPLSHRRLARRARGLLAGSCPSARRLGHLLLLHGACARHARLGVARSLSFDMAARDLAVPEAASHGCSPRTPTGNTAGRRRRLSTGRSARRAGPACPRAGGPAFGARCRDRRRHDHAVACRHAYVSRRNALAARARRRDRRIRGGGRRDLRPGREALRFDRLAARRRRSRASGCRGLPLCPCVPAQGIRLAAALPPARAAPVAHARGRPWCCLP